MDWRKNAGYIITNSITIGESEIVLGVHETRPNEFVTWECYGSKDNYNCGHYTSSLLSAQKDFLERGLEKVKFYEHLKKKKPPEPERLCYVFEKRKKRHFVLCKKRKQKGHLRL